MRKLILILNRISASLTGRPVREGLVTCLKGKEMFKATSYTVTSRQRTGFASDSRQFSVDMTRSETIVNKCIK